MGDSAIWTSISALFTGWYDMKMIIERAGMVSTDALHVITGVMLQLLFASILRRPLSAWLPWLAVLGLLLFNEAVDLWSEQWPSLAMQLGEGLKDVLLTMLLPTAMMLSLRFHPSLGTGRRN